MLGCRQLFPQLLGTASQLHIFQHSEDGLQAGPVLLLLPAFQHLILLFPELRVFHLHRLDLAITQPQAPDKLFPTADGHCVNDGVELSALQE